MPRVSDEAKQRHRDKMSRHRINDRAAAVAKYGGVCACCGEDEYAFLAIDHIGGGGAAHRREIGGGGSSFHRWLRLNNYPDGFRVLCHNCNQATAYGRTCPHQLPANA